MMNSMSSSEMRGPGNDQPCECGKMEVHHQHRGDEPRLCGCRNLRCLLRPGAGAERHPGEGDRDADHQHAAEQPAILLSKMDVEVRSQLRLVGKYQSGDHGIVGYQDQHAEDRGHTHFEDAVIQPPIE